MIVRSLLLATALLSMSAAASAGPSNDDAAPAPVLRASVTVTSEVVRIGDVVDNAGSATQIAIYRAPDLGTTGSLPTAQVLAALRAHQVIGVDTRDLREVTVTRLARTIESKDVELEVARALEHRGGLGDAANLKLTFDRDVQELKLESSNTGALQTISARVDARSGRFDVTLAITNDSASTPARLRFTGNAVETVETAVLTRDVERSDLIKASDVTVERRPKSEVGNDAASQDRAIGMQSRKPLRAGQAIKITDLVKPDLVQRDQNVTLIYDTVGLHLTIQGKALENGTEGDVVNILNLQSKRTISGVVVARGQVQISAPAPRLPAKVSETSSLGTTQNAAPVSVAVNSNVPVTSKAE